MPEIPPRSRASFPSGTPRPLPWSFPLGRCLAFAALALALAGPARAQHLRPWVPPDIDSLRTWASQARSAFEANPGDSASGTNYRAYSLVGTMGRKLLRSLGRDNLVQAPAAKTVLDSLGLETDVRVDPTTPYFVLLMVRNPFHRAAQAVGFLYWYLQDDLRMQGVTFQGGEAPQMRVWWTGSESAPYAWGIVERTRGQARHHLTVLSLTPNGQYWRVSDYDPNGLDLGEGANVTWTDLNGDLRPELVAWVPATPDSLIEPCRECPRPVNELTYVEGGRGFELLDVRVVPSPITTFGIFARLLAQGERASAARLLENPAMLDQAISLGWAGRTKNGTWKILYAEPNTAWPSWLMVRHQAASGAHDWKVSMKPVRGRWLISGWENRDDASTPGFLRPDSLARRRPAAPTKARR
jgi:hypothetical protein